MLMYPRLCLQVGSSKWPNLVLRYCSLNLWKWNYLFGKDSSQSFMAGDELSGAILNLKRMKRKTFFSLTDCKWLYNIQLKTRWGILFLPPSDAYVRSFLYLLYTLIKLYYTKALSDPASSLAPDWIRLLWRPRIQASYHSATTFP